MSRTSVLISNLTENIVDGQQRISAEVDGDIVWFDFPESLEVEVRGDLFIAGCLLEAMISNLPIKLDDDIAVSPTLLKSLDELQNIYTCWNSELSKVEVQATNIIAPTKQSKGIGSFYSGGVDGSYTFCKHKDEITHLITLAGFDTITKPEQWPDLVEKNKKVADHYNIEIVTVDNNLWQFSEKRKISKIFQFGLTLGGIAISLGFEKIYVASSYTYKDLLPCGSHPSTDPLWSIEDRTIIHDGTHMSRSDKMKFIGRNQVVLDNLQVCWKNLAHNCNTCSKCLRTRAALQIYNLKTASLEALSSAKELKELSLTSNAGLTYIEDLAIHAREANHNDIAKIFNGMIHKYLLRYHLEGFVKVLVGKKLKALVHKFRKVEWKGYRVTMEGHKDK